MELAVETGRGSAPPDSHHTPYLAKRDTVIDECLQQAYNSANVDDALMQLLAYIGREFHCGRAYILRTTAMPPSTTPTNGAHRV